jgi:hypothetical protein
MAGVGAQAMSTDFFQHPILNSPYKYPARHWELDDAGQPTQQISESRRPVSFITPIPKPRRVKRNAQVSLILGANDPYKALKTNLKAEIDQEAWESLHSDTSRPFNKPKSGRIAVKVINRLGDEVMKVMRVS